MTNYHTLTAKYYGPTNTRGSRIKITSARFEQSVTIPFDYQYNDATEIATAWLKENGHNVLGSDGWAGVIVCGPVDGSFKKLKEAK